MIDGGNMFKGDNMITSTFYINEDVTKACQITGLALDELESVVGRFAAHSHRAGLLRGKVVITDTQVQIRKCFGNKLLWAVESEAGE